jgi:hypothetical protein
MGKPIPKSLKNEVKCDGCHTGFRPEPNEKGRKFCYGCDPNNEGKVTVVVGKGDDVLYQDRAGKVEADIESLMKRVEALEKAKETKE